MLIKQRTNRTDSTGRTNQMHRSSRTSRSQRTGRTNGAPTTLEQMGCLVLVEYNTFNSGTNRTGGTDETD